MNLNSILDWLKLSKTHQLLRELYPDVNQAITRLQTNLHQFQIQFPQSKEIDIFTSSGRVELCGNHSDHQGGLVLGCAIHLDTIAIVSLRHDDWIHLYSQGVDPFHLKIDDTEVSDNDKQSTLSIIKGCCALFSRYAPLHGLNITLESTLPFGSGLSSSASFECLLLQIFNTYFAHSALSPLDIAQLAQKVENNYFKKPSGLLDQLCVAYGGVNLLDFKNPIPTITPVPLTNILNEYDLCIIKTPDDHSNLSDAYRRIVEDCQCIAHHYKQERLVDVSESLFYEELPKLQHLYSSQALLRAHHFFSEQKRVITAKEALNTQDPSLFLQQINDSGHSSFEYLNNVLHPQNNTHHIALGLAIAQRLLHPFGASRVHGGGFAGSLLCIVPKPLTPTLKTIMQAQFNDECFIQCKVRKHGVICLTSDQ